MYCCAVRNHVAIEYLIICSVSQFPRGNKTLVEAPKNRTEVNFNDGTLLRDNVLYPGRHGISVTVLIILKGNVS